MFESDVISDGTQTVAFLFRHKPLFESDVISDGTQTFTKNWYDTISLRVM